MLVRVRLQNVSWAKQLESILWCVGGLLIVFSIGSLFVDYHRGRTPGEMVVLPGIFLALGGQLLAQAKTLADRRGDESKFYLESCIRAYDEAEALLHDENNERVKWIAAERALKVAFSLASQVSVKAHKQVLELHEMKYRLIFHDFLDKDAAFFYGVSDECSNLEEAAKLSTQGEHKQGRSIVSSVRRIPESSLLTVWKAAQWPKDFEENARTSHEYFPEKVSGKLSIIYRGLGTYIEHIRHFDSAAGELHERKPSNYPDGKFPWDCDKGS